jgi:hypothetical protein
MVLPAVAIPIIAAGISAAATTAGNVVSGQNAKKAAKLRAKEMERETFADILDAALQSNAKIEAQRLKGIKQLAMRQGQSYQDTSDLVRGALNI